MIYCTEKLHYGGERHMWNNGFRQRWLENGDREARVINAARRGDLQTVLARVKRMGGVRQPLGIARSLMAAAQKLSEDVSGHKIVKVKSSLTVCVPSLGWKHVPAASWPSRQAGTIEWLPLWRAGS